MKELIDNWRVFLLQESLSDYNVNGKMRLYHYSRSGEQNINLDPEYFLSDRHSYSRRDYNISDVPRVFFYANLDHAEKMVKQGSTLFTTFVSANDVYDLNLDPLELKRKTVSPERPVPDIDQVLKSLSGMDNFLLPQGTSHKGVFYTSGNMDIVAWFEPIFVEKFDSDDVEGTEGEANEY